MSWDNFITEVYWGFLMPVEGMSIWDTHFLWKICIENYLGYIGSTAFYTNCVKVLDDLYFSAACVIKHVWAVLQPNCLQAYT